MTPDLSSPATQRTVFTTAALCLALGGLNAHAADHLDAPAVQSNGQGDINDLYAFQAANPDNSVLIMTVNPFAGLMNPTGNTSPTTFGTDVTYNFNIDTTGNAMADIVYSATFGAPDSNGVQTLTMTRNGNAYATGNTGGAINTSTGGLTHAGLFDDPFFFDFNGFNDGLNFTGDDTFAGANVSAIVLEVADSELGGNIGVWATTEIGGAQFDRMGRPAINTVLLPSARKDEFNQADPANDSAAFAADVQATIESLNGGDAGHAAAITGVLLPDILTFDTASGDGFLNGRRLEDDVIDAELTLLTNSATPIGDGVDGNDVAFSSVFPYLGEAQPIPEPTSLALLGLGGLVMLRRRR